MERSVNLSFKSDSEFTLAAVQQNGMTLKYVSFSKLRNDREVAAVQQNDMALQFSLPFYYRIVMNIYGAYFYIQVLSNRMTCPCDMFLSRRGMIEK